MIGGHLLETLHRIYMSLNQITQGSFIGKLAVGIGAAVTSFFAPIVGLLLICFATTVVDMVTGIRVAKQLGSKIESKRNWKGTLRKIQDEFTILALAHGIEWAILDISGVFVLTGGVTCIITLTELWSIIENLNTVDPDGPWRVLGKFLKKKGEEYVGMKIDFNGKTNCDSDVAKRPHKNRK